MPSVIAVGRSKWQQFFSLLGRHKNIVTIVSAFIVFASFMVKEGWDDHLRELTASIKSAEDHFMSRLIQRTDEGVLLEIWGNVFQLKQKFIFEQDMKKEVLGFHQKNVSTDIFLMGANDDLDDAEELAKALPKKTKYEGNIVGLRKRSKQLENEFDQLKVTFVQGQTQSAELNQLKEKALRIHSDCEQIAGEVLEEAKATRVWHERYHNLCVRLSYVLFSLAWALGLVSNIAGGNQSEAKSE